MAREQVGGERLRQRPNGRARIALPPDLDSARVPFRPAVTIDRPLGLTELLAETVRLYGQRIWAVVVMGLVLAGALVAASLIGHLLVEVAIVSPLVTACYAVATRIALGDPATEAWAQVGVRLPALLVLTIVVSVPFVLGIVDVVILIFSVAWLAFVGLSIPVAMAEQPPGGANWYGLVAYSITRGSDLARAEYLHVVGICAALTLIYAILGPVLAVLLTGFADNGTLAASAISSGVIGPFFFLGLSLLYFEQKARAGRSRSDPPAT